MTKTSNNKKYMDERDIKIILTKRQYEVLLLILLGFNRSEIAMRLVPNISPQAVWQIIPRIKKRLVKAQLIEKYIPYSIL